MLILVPNNVTFTLFQNFPLKSKTAAFKNFGFSYKKKCNEPIKSKLQKC